MARAWNSRRGNQGMFRFRVVFASVALAALLAARNFPPEFLNTLSTHCHISAGSHHDQRPRFDRDGPQWSAVPDRIQIALPLIEAATFEPLAQTLFVLQTKGRHYNRPPPAAS